MKKEEFPTFLNEQPAIIFGRTGRELLVIVVGLGAAYLSWLRLGNFTGNIIISDVVKGILAVLILIAAGIVTFIKVATRPLEEWAFVWIFYILVPKVYLYTPSEVNILSENQDDQHEGKETNDDDDGDY
jgi:hypothetical protein